MFAPGIPDKDKISDLPKRPKEKLWRLVVQEHLADRAGRHYDIRLADDKIAYSWATRKIPNPNQKSLAVRQPDHEVDYLDFQGEIPEGYGKGYVKKVLDSKVKILKISPNKVTFVDISKKDPEVYTLVRTKDKNWMLVNHTPTTESHHDVPLWKPFYKEDRPDSIEKYIKDNKYLLQPKIDGAHVLIRLRKGKHPEIFSYRKSSRSNRLLHHSYKIPNIEKYETSKELDKTIARGEFVFEDSRGNIVRAKEVAPLLNASTLNSLTAQRLKKYKPKIYIFDVHSYKGKELKDVPYVKRYELAKKIAKQFKHLNFTVPYMATDEKSKIELFTRIASGKDKETKEGVVAWSNHQDPPIKIKIRPEYDVYIRKIFPVKTGKNKGKLAGGFYYSYTPHGPIVGKVGTGFDMQLRKDLWQNQDKYIGSVARVTALEKYPNGALRAPAFLEFHVDKNLIKNAFLIGFLERINDYDNFDN